VLRGDTSEARILLRPIPKAAHDAGGEAMALAGGILVFESAELVLSSGTASIGGWRAPLRSIREWANESGATATARIEDQLARISRPREPILSLAFDRPCLMGVVNITPDSFSDGGDLLDPDAAAAWARALVAAGADILDIGAESTRPGAAPTTPAEQLCRLLPVMARLGDLGVPISIDTRSAEVMAEALAAGASLVNDVSGFRHDADALGVVAEAGVPVILMHSRGGPTEMHHSPSYEDVPIEVLDELAARLVVLEGVGIAPNRIILDPGIGFSKSAAHNIALLSRLSLLHGLGRPLMIGLSRKSFIARFSRDEAVRERLPGSLAGALWALQQGAQMLRVHDVAETRQAIALWCQLVGPAECG
jgi:dihydropteroate synthase